MTISKLYHVIAGVFSDKRGAAMVEYALLAGLIAVVAMGTLSTIGTKVNSSFNSIATTL